MTVGSPTQGRGNPKPNLSLRPNPHLAIPTPTQDVVIPGLENNEHMWSGKLRNKQHVTRDIFAYFKGTINNREGKSYSRGIRIKMAAALQVCK